MPKTRQGIQFATFLLPIASSQLAELLLAWAERYVGGEDWQRLQMKMRKRRPTKKPHSLT